ncbi:MAG: hypothetical protein J1F12_06220 [Muribaculaceae bacterium]|nr:hypothetical protein [Muribaculaceae bacterium]
MKNYSILKISYLLLVCLIVGPLHAKNESVDRQSYKIYVDKEGVMRRSDTKDEVSYYGTNYTLPFAHAYRAIGELGIDHKDAIDKDVYHLSRLGFNGFRLHLWDVEIADSAGNVLENEHLDLLDYLIAQLENEGIDIVLTAQTNFGNGYPEKNIDTGAFSYDYGKCEIHSDKKAQEIQANYLNQLVKHINPYTGKSYSGDNAIIAIEINNEPCHTGSKKEVTAYINKMVKALKKGGFDKPILYNVSHNPDVTEAYYNADIQGTTYQWYPTGLVAGHQRKGNFLPYVQEYPIPWKDSIKNYDKMARVVYEFDPGDVLYSYLYPAVVRTFRKEGFQWITQFAYDPIDIARYNTEYQTHFLNLAYTPSKALSMMIAAEAARNIPRGSDFGPFPVDTVFGDFSVSYDQDLSLYNSTDKFYHSNSTLVAPKDSQLLKKIAGRGSSPMVEYFGTGAYFIDEIKPGLWRLEVMPDVAITEDPFEKPSFKKEIGKIFYSEHEMTLYLPSLGKDFYYQAINQGNELEGKAIGDSFKVYPGVYLLASDKKLIDEEITNKDNLSALSRFFAPEASKTNNIVTHNPSHYINAEENLVIETEIIGHANPDEVWIYPSYISFWNENNNLIPMEKAEGNKYKAIVSKDNLGWSDSFSYNIVTKEGDKYYTWPQNLEGNPLDWDFTDYQYYNSKKISSNSSIVLLSPQEQDKNMEITMIPEEWNFRLYPEIKAPISQNSYSLTAQPQNDGKLIVSRYVGDELMQAPFMENKNNIVVKMSPSMAMDGVEIALTGSNGATYSAVLNPDYLNEVPVKLHNDNPIVEYKVPISRLSQTYTNILPAVYPSFLPREVSMEQMPLDLNGIEYVQLIFPTQKGQEINTSIQGIWLE